MNRRTSAVLLALAVAVGAIAVALVQAARVEGADAHRIAYLHVTGRGPTARAWYQGAPPSGVPVQDALDKFAADGYRTAALGTVGVPAVGSGGAPSPIASSESVVDLPYVILLER
jgi:hypothetical protein